MNQLPRDYGRGWMSKNARDMAKIVAVQMCAEQRATFAHRLALSGDPQRKTNTRTVERVIGEVLDGNKEVETE